MKFISKYKEYKIVLTPDRYIFDSFGNRTYQSGLIIQFQDNEFETNDEAIIKLLKENEWYGVDFRAVGDTTLRTDEAEQKFQEERQAVEDTLTSCPYCSFNGKNRHSLEMHIKFKHKENINNQENQQELKEL